VITVDEAPSSGEFADSSGCCGQPSYPNLPAATAAGLSPRGGGTVGALLLSPLIKGGATSQEPYSHFSLLRTIEDLFAVSHLGYAALPAVKNEMIVRVMAADLLHDPAAVLDGLQPSVRDEITRARVTVEQNLERARSRGERGERLRLQHELTRTILDAYETYLDAVGDLLT